MKTDFYNWIAKMADGNIGALTFLMDCLASNNPKAALALSRMDVLSIKGEQLYLIWNDCCNRDLNLTIDVMLKKGKTEILDHIDMQKNQGRGKPFNL